jgi:hypothetical protein
LLSVVPDPMSPLHLIAGPSTLVHVLGKSTNVENIMVVEAKAGDHL